MFQSLLAKITVNLHLVAHMCLCRHIKFMLQSLLEHVFHDRRVIKISTLTHIHICKEYFRKTAKATIQNFKNMPKGLL